MKLFGPDLQEIKSFKENASGFVSAYYVVENRQ